MSEVPAMVMAHIVMVMAHIVVAMSHIVKVCESSAAGGFRGSELRG